MNYAQLIIMEIIWVYYNNIGFAIHFGLVHDRFCMYASSINFLRIRHQSPTLPETLT